MNEFEIIKRYFTHPRTDPNVILGVGDDAAITTIPANHQLITSIDTLVSGVHFFEFASGFDIGYKSVAVSLSDMAAMGAKPHSLLLALTLPNTLANENWLQDFSQGVMQLVDQFGMTLIGGNITRGPLTITTNINGFIPNGQALLRSGARVGDDIYLSGTIGDAALALQIAKQYTSSLPDELRTKLYHPTPRVALGMALCSIANAAIDISDGLSADLAKLLHASGKLGATLNANQLPFSDWMLAQVTRTQAIDHALHACDDYELCFTAAPTQRDTLQALAKRLKTQITCVGQIEKQSGIRIKNAAKQTTNINPVGFDHFRQD